jgi:hypothetical protein
MPDQQPCWWASPFSRIGYGLRGSSPRLAAVRRHRQGRLGLWNRPALAFALEAAVLFGGMALYLGGQSGPGFQ